MCDRNHCGLEARKCVWKKQASRTIDTETNDRSDMEVDSSSESDSDRSDEPPKLHRTHEADGQENLEKEPTEEPSQPISSQEGQNESMQDQMDSLMEEDQMEEDESESRNTAQEWRREIMSSTCKGNEHFLHQCCA